MKPMPKAYSYLRFSRPEQSKGDSFRRQTEGSRDYAKRHNLDLDEALTFKDLGVSAFRGKHAQEGALGVFLKAVETGKIRKGSYLLVENLDRLSRETVGTAFTQFNNILASGVNIVTLTQHADLTYPAWRLGELRWDHHRNGDDDLVRVFGALVASPSVTATSRYFPFPFSSDGPSIWATGSGIAAR